MNSYDIINKGDYMKLILDDSISEELKDYLLTQEGIISVAFNRKDFLTVLDIKHNEKTTPYIIMKYIELFQDNKYSILFEFDKELLGSFKILKYTVEDMCCEYCYRDLVMDLYEKEKVKSVKSNFDYKMPAFNIEFVIEYDEKYTEEELIDYIKEKNS